MFIDFQRGRATVYFFFSTNIGSNIGFREKPITDFPILAISPDISYIGSCTVIGPYLLRPRFEPVFGDKYCAVVGIDEFEKFRKVSALFSSEHTAYYSTLFFRIKAASEKMSPRANEIVDSNDTP